MQKVTIHQVDSILIDTMNRLLNGAEKVEDCPPIDVENAKAIMGLAKTVIESKKLQFHVVKAVHSGDINCMPEIYEQKQIDGTGKTTN